MPLHGSFSLFAHGWKACLLDAERVLDNPEAMLSLKWSWVLLSLDQISKLRFGVSAREALVNRVLSSRIEQERRHLL
jgi:hypothetical protein